MNKFFYRLEKAFDLDDDPYAKFNYDPNKEEHAKLLEDFRKRILDETEACFPKCSDIQSDGFTRSEESCIRDCVKTSLRLSTLLMERASKQV